MNILAIVIPYSNRHISDYSMLSFPLGLAYVIGAIHKHFTEANIYVADFFVNRIIQKEDILRKLKHIRNLITPDYIIYGGMITRFSYIKILSRLLKDTFPQSKQILGGSAAGSGYKYFLKEEIINYIAIGEGENAIVDILNGNVNNNQSVIDKDNIREPKKQIIQDIDTLPIPSYSDFMVREYVENKYRYTGWKFMPMIASRGCPFSCDFCYPNFGNILRNRNVESVIEEMEYLKLNYHIDSVYFWDEVQFLNKAWMEKFCAKLIDKKVSLKWSCVSRVSLFQKKDIPLLKLAKKAGCLRITIGIESGNQQILDRMNKQTNVKKIEDTIKIIREAGIKATGSILAGYPGENQETIQDSIDFANRNLLKTSFYCLIPLPGSKIYDHCISNQIIKDEYEYLEHVSQAGGDASNIVINLTEMDDTTYEKQIERANHLINKTRLKDILKYYGFFKGFAELLKSYFSSIYLKIKGQMFETP